MMQSTLGAGSSFKSAVITAVGLNNVKNYTASFDVLDSATGEKYDSFTLNRFPNNEANHYTKISGVVVRVRFGNVSALVSSLSCSWTCPRIQ